MKPDLSPWARARLSSADQRAIRFLQPRDAVLSVARGLSGFGATIVHRGRVLAETLGHATPQAAIATVRRALAGPALVWCSACPDPAVIERDGEAWCASHQPEEVAA